MTLQGLLEQIPSMSADQIGGSRPGILDAIADVTGGYPGTIKRSSKGAQGPLQDARTSFTTDEQASEEAQSLTATKPQAAPKPVLLKDDQQQSADNYGHFLMDTVSDVDYPSQDFSQKRTRSSPDRKFRAHFELSHEDLQKLDRLPDLLTDELPKKALMERKGNGERTSIHPQVIQAELDKWGDHNTYYGEGVYAS